MKQNYDLVVVGSGPGGYVAAVRGAQEGLKTAVIERDELGGICLNWGCIPTKSLLKSAELYTQINHAADYGLSCSNVGFSPQKIMQRSRDVAGKMNQGIASLFKKYKIQHIQGTAKLSGLDEVSITASNSSDTQTVQAKNIILAAGVKPHVPPIFKLSKQIITYRQALELTKYPKNLLIIGAGAIGVEFAYFFNAFGVDVHLVETQPHILPLEDADIAKVLQKSYKKQGIKVYCDEKVTALNEKGRKVEAILGSGEKLNVEMVIVATGMKADAKALGVDNLGISVDQQGFIKTNAKTQTNLEHIYAIGDIAGGKLLAHKASAEAELAIDAICGHKTLPLANQYIPACTYSIPQVASIGYTEDECKAKNIDYIRGVFPLMASGMAHAQSSTEGMVKVILGKKHKEILGVHIVGNGVTENIAEMALAMHLESTVDELLSAVHPHPTLSEAIYEAMAVAIGKSANY